MDQGPLVTEQIEAGARLAREFDSKYNPLSAAFWLKESDDGQWFLYLVSDQIDDSNFDLAYGEVHRLLGRGPHPWLDPFQIKVTGIDDPVARAILEIQRTHAGSLPARVRNRVIGGLNIEDAYIYAIPVAAAS